MFSCPSSGKLITLLVDLVKGSVMNHIDETSSLVVWPEMFGSGCQQMGRAAGLWPVNKAFRIVTDITTKGYALISNYHTPGSTLRVRVPFFKVINKTNSIVCTQVV